MTLPEKIVIGAKATKKTNPFTGKEYISSWEKTVANRNQLIKELENSLTEDGRYHIDWYWNGQSRRYIKGHIITLERIDGIIRYYDPQNGKIIHNFYDYINNLKMNRGIQVLRVDNLHLDADWTSKILEKSGNISATGFASKEGIGAKLRTITREECNYSFPNGGSISMPDSRISNGNRNKREQEKFDKEMRMANFYASKGNVMNMLEEIPGISSPDTKANGIKVDLKSLSSHNNIMRHAKDAIYKQGAEEVWFEFPTRTDKIIQQINQLSSKGIHGRYYFLDELEELYF